MASCWICLCEEPNESGPLRRNCSCRGDSAGFAHISCIAEYAASKSKSVLVQGDAPGSGNDSVLPTKFSELWTACPNCEQNYCHELGVDLADQLLSFIEGNCHEISVLDKKIKTAEALSLKARALQSMDKNEDSDFRSVCTNNANDILAVVEDVKSIVVLPLEDYRHRIMFFAEMIACNVLSVLSEYKESTDGIEEAIQYNKRIRDSYKSIPGAGIDVERRQAAIDKLTRKRNGEGEDQVTIEELLKSKRSTYIAHVAESGKIDDSAINLGRDLAATLIRSKRNIEAHHLLTDLLASSLSIHGAGHTCTTRTQKLLDACKFCSRLVGLYVRGELQQFEAIRYKHGGASCVVQDLEDGERRIAAPTNEIYFEVGNIAVCHGLKNATHLNGKLGDVTSWHEKTGRYDIRFADEGVKSVSVKRGNLRIAFEMLDDGKADGLDR